MGIVSDLIFIVVAALIGGAIAHLLRQPLLLGYIVAGIAVGPFTGGPSVAEVHDIELLAEVGVGLLLFTVGLEFSFSELARLKKITLIIAPLQVLLCIFGGVIAFYLAGFSIVESFWVGAATSLSSTMVITKVIGARKDIPEVATRSMLGVLIAQDVLVVPLMIILPVVVGGSFSLTTLLIACSKAGGFLLALYVLGTRLFPIILNRVAAFRSQELFFLTTLTIALGTGFVAHQFGLSFALGAFVAGMLLSDTDFSHQALADVSGLKDLFGMVFFVSVGMLINPYELYDAGSTLLFVTTLLIVLKIVVIGTLMKVFRFASGLTAISACGLAQVGEFAFVITNEGNNLGILSPDTRSFSIGVAVLSMILTPQLIRLGLAINARILARRPIPEDALAAPPELQGAPLIIGGGSVSEMVARALADVGKSCTIVEKDIDRLHELRSKGFRVVFGDARNLDKLAGGELQSASVVLITTTDDGLNQSIIDTIRAVRRDIPIVARVYDIDIAAVATSCDAVSFVQPQVEAALEMVRESLQYLGQPVLEAAAVVSELRPNIYGVRCSDDTAAAVAVQRQQIARSLDICWFEVDDNSPFAGRPLKESRVREDHGLTIVAITRNKEIITAPGPDTTFLAGDSLALLGTTRQIADFVAKN